MQKGIYRDKSTQKKLIHRYRIASGHLKKVIAMIESDHYCLDVVHQSIAVQAALKKADRAVLENHLTTCVADSIKKGKTEPSIKEIMAVLEKI